MIHQQPHVPPLRFPEFKNIWSSRKLGDICTIKTGSRDTQDRKPDGQYPFYVRSDNIERIDSYSLDCEAILTSGDGVGVGKNFHYVNEKFDYHQRVYALYKFEQEYCGRFIFFHFSDRFYRRVIRLSAKNSVDSVRMNMISDMEIHSPSLPEQQKIADFLSAVDKKIQLLQRKKELLEQYKKGVMQKLFSREIRFKEENGNDYPDWEERRLGSYLIKHEEKSVKNNQYPVLTSSRIGLFFQKDYFAGNDVASKDNTGYNVVQRGYFTYRHMSDDLVFIFNINNLCDKGIVSTLYPVFSTNDKLIDHFLLLKLNEGDEFKRFALLQKQGGSRTYMYFAKLQRLKINFPEFKEQKKIVEYMAMLENKNKLINDQIVFAKQFKKGLLQQMFV